MAVTEQRLGHFRLGSREIPTPARARQEGYRLIAVLVGFSALIAWGIIDQSDQRTSRDQVSSSATQIEGPRYDGRGKWGGYLPQ